MTQFRDRERKTAVDSYLLARMHQAIVAFGRFQGFDTLTNISGLNFDLSHAGGAFKNYARDTYNPTNNLGIWKTRQGVVVGEDAAISLTAVTNGANAFERIDAVVGQHQYSDTVTGGDAATYAVVQGANGGPVAPAIATNQVLLGYLYIPASAANLTAASYTPARVRGLGGHEVGKINEINRYARMQQWNEDSVSIDIVETTLPSAGRTRQIVTFPGFSLRNAAMTANTYTVGINGGTPTVKNIHGISGAPAGTVIFVNILALSDFVTLVPYAMNAAERAAGYQPIETYTMDATSMNVGAYPGFKGTLIFVSTLSNTGYLVWRLVANSDEMYLLRTKVTTREVGAISKTTLSTSGTNTLQYWKDGNNTVHVKLTHTVTGGSSNTYSSIGTMPVNFRPGFTVYQDGLSSSLAGAVNGAVKITAAGDVAVNNNSNINATVFEFYFNYPAEG